MSRFRSSVITSNGGLRAYHELDDVLVLTTTGDEILVDALPSWCFIVLSDRLKTARFDRVNLGSRLPTNHTRRSLCLPFRAGRARYG
jgi:hypothetical protein